MATGNLPPIPGDDNIVMLLAIFKRDCVGCMLLRRLDFCCERYDPDVNICSCWPRWLDIFAFITRLQINLDISQADIIYLGGDGKISNSMAEDVWLPLFLLHLYKQYHVQLH